MYLSRALLTVFLLTQTAQADRVLSKNKLGQKVEELSEKVEELTQKGEELSWRVDQVEKESGETQHPAVAFTAALQGGGPVTLGKYSPIKFDDVVTNIGNAYNSHTGVFTAPLAGTYGFFLAVKGANIPSPVVVAIYTSNKFLTATIAQSNWKDNADSGACFTTIHLNSGDTVFARHHYGGGAIDKAYTTSFSGFLITAD